METRKYLFETKFKTYLNEQADSEDKKDLIEVITSKLNSMKNNNNFTSMSVAQTIYNNCAHFMNKTDVFANRSGEPLSIKAPFAPEK